MSNDPTPQFHLAQANISRMRGRFGDEVMQGFVDNLAPIFRLADKSPGFVWRLPDGEGYRVGADYFGDEQIILNMSVWESLETLKQFTYHGKHAEFIPQRSKWFEPLIRPNSVLWWIKVGHEPSVQDAADFLSLLDSIGPSPAAFTFSQTFEPPC